MSAEDNPKNAENLLAGALFWIELLCEAAEIDPEETTVKIRADLKDGTEFVEERSLSDFLRRAKEAA